MAGRIVMRAGNPPADAAGPNRMRFGPAREAMRARPGQWFRLAEYPAAENKKAYQLVCALRAQRYGWHGAEWEARSAMADGVVAVWARFVAPSDPGSVDPTRFGGAS